MSSSDPKSLPLPPVVQLGFAGSRCLIDETQRESIDEAVLEEAAAKLLAERLEELGTDLGLRERHFFCGISAIAIGGDMVFCKACRINQIPVRIFLPQTRDEFLNAQGSKGPDFPGDSQKEATIAFLESRDVIQERPVSDSRLRNERFADVNREIVRVSDVLVCLLRKGSVGEPGGTADLIDNAVRRCKPVLVIELSIVGREPRFDERWELPKDKNGNPMKLRDAFRAPQLPKTLKDLTLPEAIPTMGAPIQPYAAAIKHVCSETASGSQSHFKRLAGLIVSAHIFATILAAIALAIRHPPPAEGHEQIGHSPWILGILGFELMLLISGLGMHFWLHGSRTSHAWAEARLLAEVTRSVLAIGNLHVYLQHLFVLPFPGAIRPVLRTINVLQLRSTRQDKTTWEDKRNKYVRERLRQVKNGQMDFYKRREHESALLLLMLKDAFLVFWVAAVLSTAFKLVVDCMTQPPQCAVHLLPFFGVLSIVMPVLAVAALSLAAALDLEAQEQTYHEMLDFLANQEQYLLGATSERDYCRLVIETESELLGETANWFSRRSFTSVT